jgi:3-deoxy-manno-octulosonate cytidylyltransferase (CMP-KDO synthetase)
VDIHGKPMVVRVHERAARVAELTRVVVATDDERIAAACAEHGVETVMTRGDHATGTDRLAEVAEKVPADLYVNIQGDEPTLEPATIRAAVEPFLAAASPGFEVTNLMCRVRNQTDLMDSTVPKVVVDKAGDAVYLSRLPIPYPKDSRDITYYKQVCVYAFTPKALAEFARLEQGPLEEAEGIELLRYLEAGIKVRFAEVAQDTVAVDTPADLEVVRRLLAPELGG